MTIFHVIEKSTGAKVYEYQADEAIEFTGFEFTGFDHVAQAAPDAPVDTSRAEDWFINVGPFYDRFGAYKLPILASADLLVQAVIKDTTVRKYIDLRGRRAELSQALGLLRAKGYPVTDAAVLDVLPTSAEVFRG